MNWILVMIVIVAILMFYMFFNKKRMEGFADFKEIQTNYQTSQNQYFDLIDKAVFVNNGINLNPVRINNAFQKVGKSPDINYSAMFQEDDNALRDRDFQFCRNAVHPRNIRREPRATLGCAWWFVEGTGLSTGALGTLNGPVDKKLASQYPGGRWIWSLDEAAKLEDIKKCKNVKSCALINLPGINGECGFCSELGYAIPIHGDGTPKYPDMDNNCPENLILNSSRCPRIDSLIEPNEITEDIQYDNNGNVISRTFTSQAAAIESITRDVCDVDSKGNLTLDCLLLIAKANGMTESGAIAKLIRNRTAPNELDLYAMKVLKEVANILIPDAIYTTGSIDKVGAGVVMKNITDLMKSPNNRVSSAAKYLSIGLPDYNICDFGDTDQGPFPLTCLQREFRKAGCQPAGLSAPNERNSSQYDNMSFGKVRNEFSKIFNAMKESKTQNEQNEAMMQCLGTELYKKRPEVCDEPGLEYLFYTRNSDGTPDGFIGRFISKKGLIQPRRWSWDGLNAAEVILNKYATRRKYYTIRTYATVPTNTTMTIAGDIPTDSAQIMLNGQQQPRRYGWSRSSDNISGTNWEITLPAKTRNKIEIINGGPTASSSIANVGLPNIWNYAMTNLDKFQLKQESWRPLIALDFFRSSLTDFNEIIKIETNNNVVLGDLGGKRCALFLRNQGLIKFRNGIHTDNFGTITMMIYRNGAGNDKSLFIGENRDEKPSSLFFIGTVGNNLSFVHASYTSSGQVNRYWKATSINNINNDVAMNSALEKWVHLSFVFNADKKGLNIYENGVLIGKVQSESVIQTSILNNIILGSGFDGGIAWFHIYDYKLTPEEIKRDMNYDNSKYEMRDVPLTDVDLLEGKYQVIAGKDYPGNDIAMFSSKSVNDCATECYTNPNCVTFQYNDYSKMCFLKNTIRNQVDAIPEANAGVMTEKNLYISPPQNNNYVMDVPRGSSDSGVNIIMHQKHGGDNQKWRITPYGHIKSVKTGKCLDVYSGFKENGTPIIQYGCGTGLNARFTIDSNNRIHPMHAPEKCLDIHLDDFKSNKDGGRLQIWDCHTEANQKWNITPAN